MRDPSLEPWPRNHPRALAPGINAVELVIAAAAAHPPNHDKARLPGDAGIVHTTVEIHRAPEPAGQA